MHGQSKGQSGCRGLHEMGAQRPRNWPLTTQEKPTGHVGGSPGPSHNGVQPKSQQNSPAPQVSVAGTAQLSVHASPISSLPTIGEQLCWRFALGMHLDPCGQSCRSTSHSSGRSTGGPSESTSSESVSPEAPSTSSAVLVEAALVEAAVVEDDEPSRAISGRATQATQAAMAVRTRQTPRKGSEFRFATQAR